MLEAKNVLFLSYDGMTDPLGQSQVLPYLVGLSQFHNIHIVSCEKEQAFAENESIIRKICTDNGIEWYPIKYHKSPAVVSTMYDYRQMLSKTEQIHQKVGLELLHCRSYISALVGLKIKEKHNIPFIFDMRGFWADERKDAGLWNMSNPIYRYVYRYFKKKEIKFLTESDATVSLTHAAKDEIESWNIQNSPINIIPCCADFDLFNYKNYTEEDKSAIRESLGLSKNDLVLSYLGSIGTWYMLDEMLQFFKAVKETNENAKFLFITREPARIILEAAQKLGVKSSDIIVRPAQRSEVPLMLLASDISIFFIRTYYSKIASSPTKQAELMGLGLPLICNTNVGDVDRIVSEANSGIQVDKMSMDNFEEKACQIPLLISMNKERIRQEGLERFDLKKGVENYLSIYNRILRS